MKNSVDPGLKRELDAEVRKHIDGIEQMVERAEATDARETGRSAPSAAAERLLASPIDRRSFMRGSATMVGGAAIAGSLSMLMSRQAHASHFSPNVVATANPYGEPVPTLDEVTGLPLIALPPGFRYWSHGWTGDQVLPDFPNVRVPPLHDGMAVLRQSGHLAILCRNHEAAVGTAYIDGNLRFSPGGAGGNTNLIFDTKNAKWLDTWPTLSGTVRNCAGGPTPHRTWLSCEESLDVTANGAFRHGWVFEVPALGTSNAEPIRAMGRRSHEAAAVDPNTGYVYLTEDGTPGGVYRFVPNHHRKYERGGYLQMLKIKGINNANLRGPNPLGGGGAPYPVPVGVPLDVEWVDIDDPENLTNSSNVSQGLARGGADFRRPEGIWWGNESMYFLSTDGGSSTQGQIFELCTFDNTLTLLYDSPNENALDNPDNLTVTPRGGLMFCEDNSGNPAHLVDGISTERLVCLTREGKIFTFAQNRVDFSATGLGPYTRPNNPVVFNQNYRAQEWAGANFDKTGRWLFVNIQTPGVTFAITGPWEHGPL